MALLDRIAASTASRDVVRASDPVSMEEFGYLLANGNSARSKTGVTVTANRALGLSAWYSGARYLSENVAGLPWNHFQKMPNDERDRRAPFPWMAQPDTEQTWYGLIEHLVMSLIHAGNGFAFKLRNNADQVVGLREIFPDRITGGIAPDGTKRFCVDRSETIYSTREILHIPGLAYNGRWGINPIRQLADPLGAVVAADDYAQRFFAAGTHLGGIISVPQELDGPQAERLRAEWDGFHQGLINAHKTGVLSKGAVYNRVSLSAADSQLLESRQYGIAEISRMLRITPHKLYDLTHATFSNIEHLGIDAAGDSVKPWTVRIETAVNADRDLVPEGHYVEANLEGLLRGDSASRSAFYTAGINGGWLSPGTVARKENVPSPPEIDYYLRPLNMTVVSQADAETPTEKATDPASAALSPAEVSQKVYLAVTAGVLTKAEARKMIAAAGGDLTAGVPAELNTTTTGGAL